MKHLFNIIINGSQQFQVIFFVITLMVCWNIERFRSIKSNYKKWNHALTNIPFIITAIPVQFMIGILFLMAIKWTRLKHFGLTYYLPVTKSKLLVFIVTFFLLDFGEYIYHVIMHKIKSLWLFHVVHHSDEIVDSSTTFREHPGETLIRLSFTLLWVLLTGAVLWAFVLRQLIQTVTTLFAHLNYRLPTKVDRIVGLIFITPNLHHVHHHNEQPFTDSNYGDVLSIWDRLFGTFRTLPPEKINFGVDRYISKEEADKFSCLFKVPFVKNKSIRSVKHFSSSHSN